MSDFGSIATVSPAPGATGAGLSVVLPDTGGDAGDAGGDSSDSGSEVFDVNAALAAARGEAPAEEPAAEETPAADPEEQTEEQRLESKKKKLSDEKGKLDQDKLDGAFAKLTAQQRRFKASVAEHKTNVANFEKAKADYDAAIETAAERVNARDKEWDEHREAAKTSPLTVLEKLGWTVEKLVKFIQNDGKHTPEDQIAETRTEYDKRFETLQKEHEELKTSLKARDFKSAASKYEADATAKMAELLPEYEYVSKYDLKTEIAPKVLKNIALIYREGGTIGDRTYSKGTALDPKVILDYFEAQTAKEVSRFGVRPGQAGASSGGAKPGAVQPKSLSNADTSSRSVKPSNDDAEFDREAAMREVNKLLNG